jgi:hypothetical protein
MERQLLKAILAVAAGLVERRSQARIVFDDLQIVRVFYWSVLCDRPQCWACDPRNWPLWDRRQPLPSPSTLSRRLRSGSVQRLLDALHARLVPPTQGRLFWMIDGKPLVIGGASKDRQAGYGFGAGTKSKGYKLHALVSDRGEVAAWRVTPMNTDERKMARRLLRTTPIVGYVLADAHYDDNRIHAVCDRRGNLQLLTPRRMPNAKGLGHCRHAPGRLRNLELLDNPLSAFGRRLLAERDSIERLFGQLTNYGGGLTHLPPWVRTHARVHRWVASKLTIHAIRRRQPTTYVA